MKIFWSIIAVLVIITGGLLMASRDKVVPATPGDHLPRRVYVAGSSADGPAGDLPVDPEPVTPSELKITSDEIAPPPQPGMDASASNPDRLRLNPPETKAQSESPTGQPNSGNTPALTPNAPAEIIIIEPGVGYGPTIEDRDALVKELGADDTANREQTAAPDEHHGALAEPMREEAEPSAAGEPRASGTDSYSLEIIPSTFEKRDDGSTLVDGRFVMRGRGTKTDPCQVPWEMLVSTAELYDPHATRPKLPERAMMLDGKYVRITGYVAFPVEARQPDEMLVMLHAWDGCCVGVRPTACDAVGVRLGRAATSRQMLMSWGSVTGRFKVQTHVTNDGALRLYTMDEAVLTEEGK